jgi:CheY-like chemotaxis protein
VPPRGLRVTTTRGLAVAIGLLVVALLVDAAATIYNIREIATNVEWVSHAHEVLAKLEAALSSLKDAETGQRGYLLTGDPAYLDPYRLVALTGYGTEADRERTRAAGFDVHLAKPVDPLAVESLLASWRPGPGRLTGRGA